MKLNFRPLKTMPGGGRWPPKSTLAIIALALPAGTALGFAAATTPNSLKSSNASSIETSAKVQPNENYRSANVSLETGDNNTSGNSTNVKVNTNATSNQSVTSHTSVSTSGGSNASVTVNGQKIDLPANGSVSKTITDANGQTNVDVQVSGNNSDQASNSGTSSINLNVSSNSTSGD